METPLPGNAAAQNALSNICVFCGSRIGDNPVYAEAARTVGKLLASQGRTIIYGGGHIGMMGALADAALAAGGKVIGVIPTSLEQRELAHQHLTELHIVESMHHRKALMASKADAFIALPGGLGTYEEIFETATWTLLGIQDKPLGFLNVGGFYNNLLAQIDTAAKDGFLLPEERAIVLFDDDPAQLLLQLENFKRPGQPKWMTLKQS